MLKFELCASINIVVTSSMTSPIFTSHPIKRLTFLISLSLFAGCQTISVHNNRIQTSLKNKTDHILTNQTLSEATRRFLLLQEQQPEQCMVQPDKCIQHLQQNDILDKEQLYAAASELYLAKAIALEKQKYCSKSLTVKQNPAVMAQIENCRDQQLQYFNQSLRYSYVYLFKSAQSPEARVFDLRQGQIRTFYNLAVSQLVNKAHERFPAQKIQPQLLLGKSTFHFDLQHYPELNQADLERIQSSYNMNFSGFYSINRQEGLGAEFVVVKKNPQTPVTDSFILNPNEYFQTHPNPNIHPPRYLPVSAVAQPSQATANVQDILSSEATFNIEFYDPYLYHTAQVNQHPYTLTANYTVPFGLWLAENQLGTAGYKTLLNREKDLQMPHLFQLEPYQPNKKIIIMIHGLASSPETWISLTNNIMGDANLRDHYQVWQIFYSTNMPIFESRYQIQSLINQAFAQVEPNSPSARDAVLIGHSMGGVISRLLISDTDISAQALPLMNYEQHTLMLRNPVIRERFVFQPLKPVSRAVFIAAPHRGTEFADRWFTNLAKKLVVLPQSFFNEVNIHFHNQNSSTQGLVQSGPADLSRHARFMMLTANVMPTSLVPYHSIIGNSTQSADPAKMSDGIVPYNSSHLAGAISEKVVTGGHSIHETPTVIMELRRILTSHLQQADRVTQK